MTNDIAISKHENQYKLEFAEFLACMIQKYYKKAIKNKKK